MDRPRFELRTVVVEGPLALRMRRSEAAAAGELGLQIMTLPQLAAHLAGGFVRPAGPADIAAAVQAVLKNGDLTELAPLNDLPGMVRAVARTLGRLWSADVDLEATSASARLRDLAHIDEAVRAKLGSTVLAPPDLVAAAKARVAHAQRLLGEVRLENLSPQTPVWARLLAAISPVLAGAVSSPSVTGATPRAELCADPTREVIEALRWARALVASGRAAPRDIAIVAAAPGPWDEPMMALSRAAELPVHVSHGLPVLATAEGQACAALAELVLQGLSQERVRRWVAYAARRAPALIDLPERPFAGVAAGASLRDLASWRRAFEDARARRGDDADPAAWLLPSLEALSQGVGDGSAVLGERFLPPAASRVWRAALQTAPAEALGFSLAALRVPHERDPATSIVWAPAAHVAGAPRPWVRMLGLTARAWPRGIAGDPLLPEHIFALPQLASRPQLDRQTFAAVAAGATSELVLSYALRSSEGGLQAPSPLIPSTLIPLRRRALRIPEHAFSESDRLVARPDDARADPRLGQADLAWRARLHSRVTAYDGLVRPDHPALVRALAEPQSATSLRLLIRDPLAFMWRYALHWRDTVVATAPLSLDDRAFGELVHELLQLTVTRLEPDPGFGRAAPHQVEAALSATVNEVAERWPRQRPAPPPMLWRHTLELARSLAHAALTLDEAFVAGTRSWTELSFGDPKTVDDAARPWRAQDTILFPGTQIRIRGAIDRLELDQGDARARVTDYKTGTPPAQPDRVVLAGGREVQRVLYAVAVRHHRPETRILARLIYLQEQPLNSARRLSGDTLDAAIVAATDVFNQAEALARKGVTLPGPDAEESWNPFRLALPAKGEPYGRIKRAAFAAAFGAFDRVWRIA